jgi:hypothetical protein
MAENEVNYTEPSLMVEYNDGRRFCLPIDADAVGKVLKIVKKAMTGAASDLVPIGARVKVTEAGTGLDYSNLSPIGGKNGNGTYDQDDIIEVTAANAVLTGTQAVEDTEARPSLEADNT